VPGGLFNNPNSWHGPDYPAHTRFPGAGDDASISGAPTVLITGEQATRELVTGSPTFNLTGTYSVSQLFGFGSPLTVQGGGTFNVTLWQMGAQSILEGVKANLTTLQPLGSSPPSELIVRNGAEVVSQSLDRSRGALRVRVEGDAATWKHMAPLPFVEIYLRGKGRAEAPATDGVFVDAEGSGAQLFTSGRFSGYGRIAGGARIDCAEGFHSGQFTTLDGGTWSVLGTFINNGADMFIQNGGLLRMRDFQPGEFGSVTSVTGAGSRIEVAHLLNHIGSIQLRDGGVLASATAELSKGSVFAELGGAFNVSGDLFASSGVNFVNGGLLTAGSVFLADLAGRAGLLMVRGTGSQAQLAGGLAVGERGEGQLTIDREGRVSSRLGGLGIFAGSKGMGVVSGAGSEWRINPVVGGGALLIGDAGSGELAVSFGASLLVTAPAEVVLGRAAGGDGRLRVSNLG